MLVSETKIRVRYGETDRMGYAYYGIYALYYEVGRVETMRKLGFSYKDVEDRGIMMPVLEYSIKYKNPAFYDDEIKLITKLTEIPTGAKITFHYECLNEAGEILNFGVVTLAIIDKKTNKPCRLPDWFKMELQKHF